jgi:hypothetical protein
MHFGAQQLLGATKAYSRRALLKDALIALAYTAVLVLLTWIGVFKPIQEYGLTR